MTNNKPNISYELLRKRLDDSTAQEVHKKNTLRGKISLLIQNTVTLFYSITQGISIKAYTENNCCSQH